MYFFFYLKDESKYLLKVGFVLGIMLRFEYFFEVVFSIIFMV